MGATQCVAIAAALTLLLSATPATAQPGSCDGAEHRQFDFWVGDWEVRGADGTLLGRNVIERVAAGCGLLERWTGAGGGIGMSINAYDAAVGGWTQRWVGAGALLWLVGGLDGHDMVLTSTARRDTPRGPALDRITWAPLADGRVQQTWEMSTDGENWTRIFDGYYTRITEGDPQ